MKEIDCLGDMCPIPILKLKKELKTLKKGDSILFIVDHSCVLEEIKEFIAKRNHQFEIDEVICGVWEITITYI